MSSFEKKKNKNVLLLNSFVNESIECNEKDSYKINGHLYSDTPIGILSIYSHVRKELPDINANLFR